MPDTIFLVGFDPEARARIRVALPARHDIVELDTAEAVLDRLATVRPDAVILHFPVPFRDGRSLTAVLRRDPRTATIPIVAVSRWAWRRTRQTAARLGCTAFVALDAPTMELRRVLRRGLRTLDPGLRRPGAAGTVRAGSNVA